MTGLDLLSAKIPYAMNDDRMQRYAFLVPANLARMRIERILKSWAESQDARLTPQGRLARTYKTRGNSMHWHITGLKAGMGTVEVTYLPDEGKVEVSVHDNRRGYWAGEACFRLRKKLKFPAKENRP